METLIGVAKILALGIVAVVVFVVWFLVALFSEK